MLKTWAGVWLVVVSDVTEIVSGIPICLVVGAWIAAGGTLAVDGGVFFN